MTTINSLSTINLQNDYKRIPGLQKIDRNLNTLYAGNNGFALNHPQRKCLSSIYTNFLFKYCFKSVYPESSSRFQ